MARRKKGIPAWLVGLVILLLIAWYLGYIQIPIPTPISQVEVQQGVIVNKPLKIAVIDQFAGSAVASASVKIYEGQTLKESLTTGSDGTVTTALNYRSGQVLNILVTSSNSKEWFTVEVPRMNPEDAESMSYNPIELRFFTLASISLAVRDSAGNVYSDGGSLNKTTLGNTVTLTISWYVANDNTGFVSSEDPINNLKWLGVLYAKCYGTNYETISITGFDGAYAIGTTNWFYHVIPDTDLTKYKVGNTYVYSGTGSITINLDLTGYSGDAADLVLYLVVYTDPTYHQSKASFGPDAVTLATFTLNIVD